MSAQPFRAASGGAVDRTRALAFSFDGRRYQGFHGDTLASALLANGVRLVGRSFKYHRPRGVFGAGAEEPNALVRLRAGARAEPNLRATQIELYDGLEAASQNYWPRLDRDLGAINDLVSPLIPAGFYYKTFMWPGSWWMLYERFIRRAAGLGRASLERDPDHYARRYAHCDVLVVGAGPAGLSAAHAAGLSGARVILLDEHPRLGGSLRASTAVIDDLGADAWVAATHAALATLDGVRVLTRTTAFGYYDDNMVVALERVADHLAEPPAFTPRERVWWIRARQVVLATGAIERPMVFADNDRPGVMLASAAQRYAREFAVRCGDRAVVFTNNDSAYDAAAALTDAGARVAAVVDARDDGPGEAAAALVRRHGVECLHGHAVTRALGARSVQGVEVMRLEAGGASVGGARRRIDCDVVCVSGGFSPTVHLFSQSQGQTRFDARIASFVPGESRQAERSAGAARGTFDLAGCLAEGVEAGLDAAERAGSAPFDMSPPRADSPGPGEMRALWAVPAAAGGRAKRFVDLQNDVTIDDVELAAREGYRSVEHLKRYTTLGMGTDQGRTSNVNGLAVLAATLGADIASVGHTTFRPPYSPVALGAVAGREIGERLAPVRRTPMQAWHESAGAAFVPAGQWLRPQYYARAGEDAMDAINREVLAVRRSVGMVDVSTLGKIEVRGRDAAEFLHRIYINRMRGLAVGRCRYGFMLREDGFVLDDGTATRIAADEFYVTTTTAQAGPVMAHMEFYAQTVWPDLHVHLTSVSDQWAGLAIAGPSSREVLADACDGADVSDAALPTMGCVETTVAGAPVRIIRMTFSGERAFEVHTPADFGLHVWEAMLEAGRRHAMVTYGTEAMGVLRIEKGHVVAAELDGRTIPGDFGFARMQKSGDDFVGRRSLERAALDGGGPRRTFVGLVSESGRPIPRGAQLCWNPSVKRPVPMLGHVTSHCFSANLDRHIGLGLLERAERWMSQVIYAACPLTSRYEPVRVAHPVFIDPQGDRARG